MWSLTAFPFSGPWKGAIAGWSSSCRRWQSCGSLLSIAMLCNMAQAPIIRQTFSGLILTSEWSKWNLRFHHPEGLFNGHPCSFMGLVECFLIYRCRVEIWGHEIWVTRVPTISKKQAIFQCAGLRLKPLTNQWTAKYEAVMCATRPSCNDVRKHA